MLLIRVYIANAEFRKQQPDIVENDRICYTDNHSCAIQYKNQNGGNNMTKKYTNADGKIPTQYLPPKFSLTIRVLVGAYVIYLSYGLIDGVVGGEGRDKYFLGAFMIAFAVIGLLLLFFSGRDLLQGKYVGGAMDAGDGEAEEPVIGAAEDERQARTVEAGSNIEETVEKQGSSEMTAESEEADS